MVLLFLVIRWIWWVKVGIFPPKMIISARYPSASHICFLVPSHLPLTPPPFILQTSTLPALLEENEQLLHPILPSSSFRISYSFAPITSWSSHFSSAKEEPHPALKPSASRWASSSCPHPSFRVSRCYRWWLSPRPNQQVDHLSFLTADHCSFLIWSTLFYLPRSIACIRLYSSKLAVIAVLLSLLVFELQSCVS